MLWTTQNTISPEVLRKARIRTDKPKAAEK
jgi:hypothetical protein